MACTGSAFVISTRDHIQRFLRFLDFNYTPTSNTQRYCKFDERADRRIPSRRCRSRLHPPATIAVSTEPEKSFGCEGYQTIFGPVARKRCGLSNASWYAEQRSVSFGRVFALARWHVRFVPIADINYAAHVDRRAQKEIRLGVFYQPHHSGLLAASTKNTKPNKR